MSLRDHPFRRLRRLCPVLLGLFVAYAAVASAHADSRIKDIVDFDGVRDNDLVGYGLVVGLNGTGDSLTNAPFTGQSLTGMLERLGVNTHGDTLRTKDVAAVMVTATLGPFAGQGTKIDVNVAAMGDATSLLGGTLLVTPLLGADGEVYAVAQGPVAVSGFSAVGQAASITRGVPTNGRIANGGIVEREVRFDMADMPQMRLSLRNPDFTTAQRIATVINQQFGTSLARAMNPANVVVQIPASERGNLVAMMTEIEQLRVAPDEVAKVVIDEKSGVIVMGENVRISTVAIAQGNLTIQVNETPQVSQPNAFSSTGTTTTVPRTSIQVSTGKGNKLAVMQSGVSLQELVANLNALGVGPRDMISILQSIKAAGALQADIEVM